MELVLYLTNKCNMNCKYCYQGNDKKNYIMDFDKAKKCIDDATKKCEYTSIGFFGGEPLLNKELFYDIVNYCNELEKTRKHKFGFSITTNGTLIDDEFVKFCKKNRIAVGISIDGTKESHDINRIDFYDTSTYEKTLEGARKCIKEKVKCMALPVICTNNVNDLSNNVDYLIKEGFREITCNFNYEDSWDDDTIEVLKNQYSKLEEIYMRELKNSNPIHIYPIDTKMSFIINEKAFCNERCNKDRTCVNADGKYYPCIQFVGKEDYCIGNVIDGEDKKKRFELIKRRNTAETPCDKCVLKRLCGSGCGCIRLNTTGDIIEVSPLVCETEKIYINTANNLIGKINKENEFVKFIWRRGSR